MPQDQLCFQGQTSGSRDCHMPPGTGEHHASGMKGAVWLAEGSSLSWGHSFHGASEEGAAASPSSTSQQREQGRGTQGVTAHQRASASLTEVPKHESRAFWRVPGLPGGTSTYFCLHIPGSLLRALDLSAVHTRGGPKGCRRVLF